MQFQAGKTYQTRSACDYDTVYSFTVVSRTEKTITLKSHFEIKARKVYLTDGVEHCNPLGTYSMHPVIRANKEIA
jgi:hypothetical protein